MIEESELQEAVRLLRGALLIKGRAVRNGNLHIEPQGICTVWGNARGDFAFMGVFSYDEARQMIASAQVVRVAGFDVLHGDQHELAGLWLKKNV